MKFIAFLLQLPLIVLTKDVALSETTHRDSSAPIVSTTPMQFNSTESTTTKSNETSTASSEAALRIDTTTPEPTSTTNLEQLLIPPARVEAQIVNADISTKKPTRLQIAA